ncbi:MAG: HD domain-containing phosphohydrolase [Thermodesulfobacteriota bacterium]|nr:HD domain-containing phosphohydrolase [Thermodesulfobacteriota bacterium]
MVDNALDAGLKKDPAIDRLLEKMVQNVRTFAEKQVAHTQELIRIGLALSGEKDLDRLLEMIVNNARDFTNADGGTLYIKDENNDVLSFAIVQNDTLNISMGGTGEDIAWPPVPLKDKEGNENHSNVSAHCALVCDTKNIPDVYDAEGFDFQGTKGFDSTTGYRSKSMLVIPMLDHEDEVIGVLQLLNARDRKSGEVVTFPEYEIEMITSLASQAAIAITKMRLIKGLENLLNSFVVSIADAIDEKSPYTAGHILNVAELTERIVKTIQKTDEGEFADIHFSPDEAEELRMAAWMHDIGKITTPEYIVDKSTKLKTIFDRIEIIGYRMEILKRDARIRRLQKALDQTMDVIEDDKKDQQELDEYMAFLESVNMGGEFLSDESVKRIRELSKLSFDMNGKTMPLLSEDEAENLMIRKGTITNEEREIINNHVTITSKMLGRLPFPKKLHNVPLFAGMHHEKLDGSGYPDGLSGNNIPLAGRILAVADIFEALIAVDRPYRPGKTLSESMRILGFMVKDGHLDSDLCDLVVESGIVTQYAKEKLSHWQQDDFDWNGKTYSVEGEVDFEMD